MSPKFQNLWKIDGDMIFSISCNKKMEAFSLSLHTLKFGHLFLDLAEFQHPTFKKKTFKYRELKAKQVPGYFLVFDFQ